MGIGFFNQRKNWRMVFTVGLIVSLFSQIAFASISRISYFPDENEKHHTLTSTFDSFQENDSGFDKFCDPFSDDDKSENNEKEASEEEKYDSEDDENGDLDHLWNVSYCSFNLATAIQIKCACHKRISILEVTKPLYILFHSWKSFLL